MEHLWTMFCGEPACSD
ncbi:hypothetical protein POUND7_005144, partial [Theobroma cacao]